MQRFLKIKRIIGKRVLKNLLKKENKRRIKYCNINTANSFGILCVIENENDYKKILKLVKYLRDEFGIRNVKALAYYTNNDDPPFLISKLGLDFFRTTDLNLFCFPNSVIVRNFINTNFDILLDITNKEIIPQRFVTYYSKSSLKVGTFSSSNKDFYDLMIKLNSNDFEEYINQVVIYLDMINKDIGASEKVSLK